MIEALLERFRFDAALERAARAAVKRVDPNAHAAAQATVRACVLRAFMDEGIAESDLAPAYGYGYDDPARARYESLLARIFGADRALARLSLVSGTHAIVTAIEACLPPGGRLICATGRPYDTLRNALVEADYAIARRGGRYAEVPLDPSGAVDYPALERECEGGAGVVFVQRSRGYAPRPSLSAHECGAIATCVRRVAASAFVLVDNCYGELVEAAEPTHHGVDAVMGSLIKNLGLGAAVGPTLGYGRALIQGLYNAPLVIGECLAGLDLAAALFIELGEAVDPLPGPGRRDIVQAIRLGSAQRVLAFARGLQRAMPLNARFSPEPGPVPGYPEPGVMSSGAFIPGATIELSCDAPLRPPYDVYLQGGINREQVLIAALFAADALRKES